MADKFRKGKSNFATTLVTGIGTGTGDTITLNSTTGLPTDTEITLTFNRVTSGGVVNSTAVMERITGTISGATLINYTRGVDGTTEQAHAGGVVVEYIPNAADMNDQIDGILVEHNQDGTHNTTKVVDLDTAQTLENKTIGTTNLISFNAPEGFLINGKIVPSVASNNLTVALKGLDGNDPSATNPVYVRINGVVRTITGALSTTDNAGANVYNAGSAELATKEIDYFVYLVYSTVSNAVVMGISRIPYATIASDFSAAVSNEKFSGIYYNGNGVVSNSGDAVVNIGRFAATLSAGPGYTWSVPTFTSANLIQRPIFTSRWLSYVPVVSGTGGSIGTFAANPYVGVYRVFNTDVSFKTNIKVTNVGSWSGNVTHILPFTSGTTYGEQPVIGIAASVGDTAATVTDMGFPVIFGASCYFIVAFGSGALTWGSFVANDYIYTSGIYEILS